MKVIAFLTLVYNARYSAHQENAMTGENSFQRSLLTEGALAWAYFRFWVLFHPPMPRLLFGKAVVPVVYSKSLASRLHPSESYSSRKVLLCFYPEIGTLSNY